MISTKRKYTKVWIEKRLNPPKQDGSRTTSYTLEWLEFGKRRFQSLGAGATKTFALAAAREKEAELNSITPEDNLTPLTWKEFRDKFLDTHYPGHELPTKERDKQVEKWANAIATMREEKRVLDKFQKTVKPQWCNEVTSEDREAFIQERLDEVGSGETVNKELKILRHLFNVLEEWHHRKKGSNPFSGNGKATIGARRKRRKQLDRKEAGKEKPEFYNLDQVRAILAQADQEVEDKPEEWRRQRLRALVYFIAYTGARSKEVLFLEWKDIDFDKGIANLCFRIENMLKTEGSEAPVGLADPLIDVLKEWKTLQRCSWVFPNLTKDTPWVSGSPGYKPLDEVKELAKRAGVEHATCKMFRDTLTTLGKSLFGLSKDQLKTMLRHTTTKTQVHYTHDELVGLRHSANSFDFSPPQEDDQ